MQKPFSKLEKGFLFVGFCLFYYPTLQFILSVVEVHRQGKYFSLGWLIAFFFMQVRKEGSKDSSNA